MRVREECKPDSEDVQIQCARRDPHQELMLLEKLTGNYRLRFSVSDKRNIKRQSISLINIEKNCTLPLNLNILIWNLYFTSPSR